MLANLIHPSTIDSSYDSDGAGAVHGIKIENDQWEFRGHANRVVSVTSKELALFAALYDDADTDPLEARLPVDLEHARREGAPVGDREFFNWVAFSKFVPGLISRGPRCAPNSANWEAGRVWFPDQLESIAPDVILVLGKRLWWELPEYGVSHGPDHEWWLYTSSKGGGHVSATMINHPSSWGFSTEEWHPRVVKLRRWVASVRRSV